MEIEKVYYNKEPGSYCEKCNKLKCLVAIVRKGKTPHVICNDCLHFGIPADFKAKSLIYNIEADNTTLIYEIKEPPHKKPIEKYVYANGRLSFEPTIFNLYLLSLT